MIAVCPNCRVIKTRGRTRKQLQRELFVVAERRHRELCNQPFHDELHRDDALTFLGRLV